MGSFFLTYYVISVIYCFFQLIRTYRRTADPDALNIAPGLDAVMVLMLGWALAPVDLILRWITMYKAAEEARRRNDKRVL
jgi:hypothetical protein